MKSSIFAVFAAILSLLFLAPSEAEAKGTKKRTPRSYATTSLVPWLDARNMPSEFKDRLILAEQLGVDNYDRSAEKNSELLTKLKQREAMKNAIAKKSIVDFLVSVNLPSDFETRKAMTGNPNYTGTAKENIHLLNAVVNYLTHAPANAETEVTPTALDTAITQASSATSTQLEEITNPRTEAVDQEYVSTWMDYYPSDGLYFAFYNALPGATAEQLPLPEMDELVVPEPPLILPDPPMTAEVVVTPFLETASPVTTMSESTGGSKPFSAKFSSGWNTVSRGLNHVFRWAVTISLVATLLIVSLTAIQRHRRRSKQSKIVAPQFRQEYLERLADQGDKKWLEGLGTLTDEEKKFVLDKVAGRTSEHIAKVHQLIAA